MPTSPEAQIRTRARQLPIGKCFINKEWKKTQMASVIVSRKHVNGNITYGFYLVDLNLLGVKDCFYAFNESPVEMEERIHDQFIEFVECDYALAHNIIFEGIAFAEKYGFQPVKEFSRTGIYILEENSDDIPVMDISLGKDGVPVIFTAPDKNMQREISILEKTAGVGNFIVYNMDEDGYLMDEDDDGFDDDEFDDEDDDSFSYEDVLAEIQNVGIEEYMDNCKDTEMSLVQLLALSDICYFSQYRIPDHHGMDDILTLILEDKRYDSEMIIPFRIEKYKDAIPSIINKLVDDEEAAYEEMEALIADHYDDIDLNILYINILRDLDQRFELERLTRYWYRRAKNHYAVRLLYAQWLTEQERYDEVFQLFSNRPGLDALTTENLPFTDVMISEFCACYVMAWLSKDNIEKAEAYYQIIILLENWTPFVKNALLTMMSKKKEAVLKKTGESFKEN